MGDLLHIHDPHGRAQRLLPWLVNGTLDASEEAEIRAHLAECGECRADFERERELRNLIADTAVASDDGWARLSAKVAERPPAASRTSLSLMTRRVPLLWAIGAQAAVAAGIAGVFLVLPESRAEQDQGYHLLASPEPRYAGNLIVLFTPETTEREMRSILSKSDARIADGPTASGAYVLTVDPARVDAAIAVLRGSPETILAEPIAQDTAR